jgi:hypothetical protein
VAPEKLEALLPVVKGWQKGQSDSETMNVGIVMSVARVSYEKGDLGVSLEITDTLGNAMLMGPVQTMLSSATPAGKTVDGVTAKTFAVGGFTGVEVWDSKEKVADAIVAVGGRFLVKASQSDARDTTAVRAVVEVVNLKALADLK